MKRSLITQLSVTVLCVFSLVGSALADAEELALSKCPVPVQKTLRETGTVKMVVKFMLTETSVLYEADVRSETGNQIDIVVTEGAMELDITADGKVAQFTRAPE